MHQSIRGHFLIASKPLKDPNFFRTVVLIVEHNAESAMGLVINRPSSVSVSHALSEHFELPINDEVVYFGGPVEPTELFILHNSQKLDDGTEPVIPGLYVGNSPEVFESIVRSAAEGDRSFEYRIFSGCAGWASGQLDGELERGDWYHMPAPSEAFLYEDPYRFWSKSLRNVSVTNHLSKDNEALPEWN